jgi:hypothetical protein
MATVAELKKDEFIEQVKRDISFDANNVGEAMEKQAPLFVYYAEQLRDAVLNYTKLKLKLEVETAKKARFMRKHWDGPIKLTESGLEAELSVDEGLIKLKMAVNEASGNVDFLKNVLEGFREKKDMLIQFSATHREAIKNLT